MSKYLAQLKSEKRPGCVLPKLSKGGFGSYDSTEGEHISEIQGATPADLQRMVGAALAETDRLGRPWPSRFMIDLPEDDRQRLRELERQIDQAVLNNDGERLPRLLDTWRRTLLAKLN